MYFSITKLKNLYTVVGRTVAPKGVHVLLTQPCECQVISQGGIKSADGIKLANQLILKWEDVLIIWVGSTEQQSPFYVEEGGSIKETVSWQYDCQMLLALKMEEDAKEPRNVSSLQELEKAK